MGCGASTSRSRVVNVDAEDWNAAYMGMHKSGVITRSAAVIAASSSLEESAASIRYDDDQRIASINGYAISKALGKGAFGEVFLAQKSGEQFAIKSLKKKTLKKSMMPRPGAKPGASGGNLDAVKSEIATLKKIAHPNCVGMLDVIHDPTVDAIFIVLEFVDGGCSQEIDGEGKPVPLPDRTIWSHLRHFVMGLEYLHMHGIVHRDIKPDNLMLTRPGKMYEGGAGVLKITDFGTSCLCQGDKNAQKTAGTPMFFSPELCTKDTGGTYDPRVVDLWAAGVTLYLWACGRLPFQAPTVLLVMEAIADAPAVTPPPPEASAGLGSIIQGLLTRDPASRLTLANLRHHEWLTDGGKQPLPVQPVVKIEVTPEEVAQAVSNRAAIAEGSAAGPSAFGHLLQLIGQGDSSGGWKREGVATIRKRSTEGAATFWRAITASGHLAPHVPLMYSITPVDEDDDGEVDTTVDGSLVFDIRMHDLVAPMTRPCALGMLMGNRSVTAAELTEGGALAAPLPELLGALEKLDPSAVSEDERSAGAVTPQRYLQYIDGATSTNSLGFRVDACKTIVDGALAHLPMPASVGTYDALKEEADLIEVFKAYVQHDAKLAKALVHKMRTLVAALERSEFFTKHVFLRSRLLLVYDDAAREELMECKMMNFIWSYAAPEGVSLSHDSPWDGTAACHEDGFLTGVHSLVRLLTSVCEQLGGSVDTPRTPRG